MILAVQPAVLLFNEKPKVDCCAECCHKCKDFPKQENKTKDDCNDKTCNPFQGCRCCVGYTLTSSSINLNQSFVHTTEHYIFKESIVSSFSSKIWQPPKIS